MCNKVTVLSTCWPNAYCPSESTIYVSKEGRELNNATIRYMYITPWGMGYLHLGYRDLQMCK